jgi:hypothetical protein
MPKIDDSPYQIWTGLSLLLLVVFRVWVEGTILPFYTALGSKNKWDNLQTFEKKLRDLLRMGGDHDC